MMAKVTEPSGFSEGATKVLEQTHQAMDVYFDFLENCVLAVPSAGTEFGEKWKEESLLNIAAFQELVKRLTTASNFEEAFRIQTAFMHSQLNRLSRQSTSFGEAFDKAAEASAKKSSKDSSD
jgi:hypothetical protein